MKRERKSFWTSREMRDFMNEMENKGYHVTWFYDDCMNMYEVEYYKKSA